MLKKKTRIIWSISDNEEELKEAYKTLYIKYEKLREG